MQAVKKVQAEVDLEVVQASPALSKKMLWTGRVISALPVLLLIFSGAIKLAKPPALVQGFEHFGLPLSLATALGILEIGCTVVYMIPRTAVLGAILMTGYLGGATATNVRIGDSWFMPVLLGVLVWGGLFLRDVRLRELIPFRR
jgi:DoxX-like family